MKQFNLFSIVALIAILFSSCGSEKNEITIKNESTDLQGGLSGYLEVVDGTYKVTYGDNHLILNVKLKAVQALGEDVVWDQINAELLDESGMPLPGVGTFSVHSYLGGTDADKIDNALREGSGEFSVQLEYDGDMWREEAWKIVSKDAKSFSIISTVEESNSSSTSSSTSSYSDDGDDDSDNSTASTEDWDEILRSYESYINQYIELMKKAKNGDVSAVSEYPAMMEKATDLAEKLQNASSDLSTAQMNKFLKLQTKLTNAATEMY